MRRLLLLTVLLTGCGASEQQHVQQALRDHDAAWEREDYTAVCAQLTEAGRRQWAELARHRECVDGIRRLTDLGADHRDDPGAVVVTLSLIATEPLPTTRILIDGDTATTYTRLGVADRLRKVDGRWLVDASVDWRP